MDPQILRRFEINREFKKELKDRRFKNNSISTTKYNCLTFLPKDLFVQFTKMANFYFLILTLLELVPKISSDGGFESMLLPLCFVVGVSMIKDIFEDRKRYLGDKEENNRTVNYIPRGTNEFITKTSSDIQVGCIVRVKENEFFPCDLLLLNSAIPKGICYVETKSLDGETNLKHKQAHKDIFRMALDDHGVSNNFTGAVIECE